MGYYVLLRSVLRARPELRRCRTLCRHCGIFFLTHPRNAGREDLRCPFGCREAHRKQESTRRSVAYYQDEAGKLKKRIQNAKRRTRGAGPPPAPPAPVVPAPEFPPAWRGAMLGYLRMVIGLLERRPASPAEVVAMLLRALRQHRIGRSRRIDQTLAWLHGKPP